MKITDPFVQLLLGLAGSVAAVGIAKIICNSVVAAKACKYGTEMEIKYE